MTAKKFSVLILGLFIMLLFIFSGCSSAARKPGPTQPVPNQTQTDNAANEKARRIAREADQVDGVKQSTVVVSGTKAYIGLDIKSNIEKNQTKAVENAVIKKIKGVEPSINTVYVSSDADTVTRIKKISQGVVAGKPVSSFTRELSEIGRRITPRTM